MMVRPTKTGEELISDLADTLDIPADRYDSADRSYRSVRAWLERPESLFTDVPINVYTQGSFRMGTVIRPINGDEHYDLDIVCEIEIDKLNNTQRQLHGDLGHELKLYATRHGMDAPSPWNRCWTLNYADKAQFHMDVLPSVPDGKRQRMLREADAVPLEFVDKSISITDRDHENYDRRSDDWPVSNPNGYAEWFYERMKPAFEMRRRAMMLAEAKADISEIPAFRVKTPLQSAIQILKRHRDVRFSEEPEGRPTSIVITTLSAHSYRQESTITGALFSILDQMDSFIERRGNDYWIPNPSNPRENFADLWNDERSRKEAFDDWLETARTDFRRAAEQNNSVEFVETLAPRMGRQLIEAAAAKRNRPATQASLAGRVTSAVQRILDAPHRKPIVWPTLQAGSVELSAVSQRNGFRPLPTSSNGLPIAKQSSLRFIAQTSVARPYKVYWQVVNIGPAAAAARQLRGGFEEADVTAGTLTKEETASYTGAHSIECFIVKDGYCAARSGPFVVNVE